MWITIEVPLDDPMLDLSQCTLNKTVDYVEYGDRKVPLIQYEPDLPVAFGGYEVIDAQWEAIEEHLLSEESYD